MPTRDQVLRAIHHLQQATPVGMARMSELAARLGLSPSSIVARVQKLADAGLVVYTSRRGATLTDEGERQATTAAQRLRLIERFLGEVLVLPAESVASDAESLARYASNRVMDGIAQYFESANGGLAEPQASAPDRTHSALLDQ